MRDMFEEGTILYFTPFIFPDGGTPKAKYFLVLKRINHQILLASLPTSKDSVPSYLPKIHGCIDRPAINFNCYYFEGGRNIATDISSHTHFAFPIDTYVYGFRINCFDSQIFEEQAMTGKTDIEIKGKLYSEEYEALISCLKTSSSVKRKFRRLLSEMR